MDVVNEDAAVAVDMPPATEELARRALAKVSFEDRLVAYRMSPAAGNVRIDLYSFTEVGEYMFGTQWHEVGQPDARVDINWLDVDKLSSWLENVIGDAALAKAVHEVNVEGMSFREQVMAIGPLLKRRFEEYQALLTSEPDQTESD